MNDLLALTPGPPAWQVDWAQLQERFSWIRNLACCPQDPVFHAEGDVGVHTRMVAEALARLPAWRSPPEEEPQSVFAAALLHDVAKPTCTRLDPGGRITSRGHSRRGAILARQILWRLDVPRKSRTQERTVW
jgi:hypothetical protein